MPTTITTRESRAPQPIGETAEKEAAAGAADADRGHQENGRRLRDAVVHSVGDEVNERHEHPERAKEARGAKPDKPPRS
jgi:hypothetical protein